MSAMQLPFKDACELAGVSRQTGIRWIASNRWHVVGRSPSKRGKPSLLIDAGNLLGVDKPRSAPSWTRFRLACKVAGYDASRTLGLLLLIAGLDSDAADPDLLHAGIYLTLTDGERFLPMLHCDRRNDKTFSGYIASLLHSPPLQRGLGDFPRLWKATQSMVRKWSPNTGPILGSDFQGLAPVVRLFETPSYLKGCPVKPPAWAAVSIIRVERGLRAAYAPILPQISRLIWCMKNGRPVENGEAWRQTKRALTEARPDGCMERALFGTKQLDDDGCRIECGLVGLLGPEHADSARSFLVAWRRRCGAGGYRLELADDSIEANDYETIKVGRGLSRLAVARVFCMSR